MSAPQDELLRLEHLRVTYPGRRRTPPVVAVADLSLTVARGETVAIVGESGSGKSTTLSALLGLLPRTAEVRYDRLDVGEHRDVTDPATLRGRALGLVPQDPARALDPLVRIGENFAELHRHLLRITDRDESRRRALDTLESVGVDRPELRLRQYPHELSGGLRQRILIGLALVAEPRLLLADEPTSNLDATVQRRVLDLFDQLRAERGLGLLLVTHDLAVAAERADRIVVVRHGQLVETGPARAIVRSPHRKYTRELVHSQPSLLPARPRFQSETPPRIVLTGQGLSKSFGGVAAVQDIDLQLHRGQSIAIVGESGAGKSTLLRLLTGLERPDAGTVQLGGALPRRGDPAFSRAVQLVYQNPASSLNPAQRVGRIIAEPLEAHRVGTPAGRAARARQLLEHVELPPDIADRRPTQLSGGQAQRVAIARALALEPDVVALDEPVSALDQAVQYALLRLLTSLQETLGIAYLLVSHDLGVVRAVADEVIVMRDGRVEERGPTDTVFARPTSAYTRTLLDAVPVLDEFPASSPPERSA
ncbi:ABC transporter ATP-binding protein [Nocardia sp. NPDC050717]|uniref:ABC transporter ATP-binding protein n=1 Tax=Nocardia sp. NPDC050717 TaxID=3157221 RepID=UPI0033FAF198